MSTPATSATQPTPAATRAHDRGAINDLVGLRLVEQNVARRQWTFESVEKPFALGNASQIAYGGFTVSIAVAAAAQSIAKEDIARLRLYSILGNFLGPTQISAPVQVEVTSLRDTRSFATRLVVVKQAQGESGAMRATMSILIDFIGTRGDRTMDGMTYSAQPRAASITPFKDIPTYVDLLDEEVKAERLAEGIRDAVEQVSKPMHDLIDQRLCPEGLFRDNLGGVLSHLPTKQDDRVMTDKVTYDWFKQRPAVAKSYSGDDAVLLPPTPQTEAACLYALVLDAAIAFTPLAFTKRFIYDVEACSTLEFALRFHVDDLRPERWNLREIVTHAGGDERTHSEARLWQETEDGSKSLVATMTQSSIMRGTADGKQRPRPVRKPKAAKL